MDLSRGDTRMIIDACIEHGLLRNQCAYVLATAHHETAHTMKPVREMGGEAYLKSKKYYPYVGMGYVQLTWKDNYQKASKELGVDFVRNPELLLLPKHAARILVVGMKEGWFTTKKLSDYVTLKRSDFHGARRIINGMDRADLIAGYAKQYDALLKAEGYGVEKPATPKPSISAPSSPETTTEPATPQIPSKPGVVHVEDNPPAVKPGPAPAQPENLFWRLLRRVLGKIWPAKEKAK